MKKIHLSLLLIFIAPAIALGQYGNFGAQMANRQFQQQMMNNMLNMSNKWEYNKIQSKEYTFTVTMPDSSRQEVKSKIYTDTTLHKDYLIYENKDLPKSDSNRKTRIYANETLSIERDMVIHIRGNGRFKTADKPPRYFAGTATDSCWLFKSVKGAIIMYSYLSEEDGRTFPASSVVALQKGDDAEIIKFTPENVEKLVFASAKAMDLCKKKRYYEAVEKYNQIAAKLKEKAKK